MKFFILCLTFSLFCGSVSIIAQDLPSSAIIENIVEEIASSTEEEDIDYRELTDRLYYLLNNPLPINTSGRKDLEDLYFLSDQQIENLLFYIYRYGPLLTEYELRYIDGFDLQTAQWLSAFVYIGDVSEIEKYKGPDKGRGDLFVRTARVLEKAKGFSEDENGYKGDIYKQYLRLSYEKSKISFGLTAEKDPGEPWLTEDKIQPDFYSMYVRLQNAGVINDLVIGDFQMKVGQGLIMWNGLTMEKSAYVLNIRKNSIGLRRYSSTNENQFLRGAGISLKKSRISFNAFVSSKKIDANVELENGFPTRFTSFQTTGYHRTESEIEDKNSIREKVVGLRSGYSSEKFEVNGNFIAYNYNLPFQKQDQLFNRYFFSGKSFYNASVDYQFRVRKILFFGETGIDKNMNSATVNGVSLSPAPAFQLSVLHRNYPKDFNALYGNAFSVNKYNQNESGLYIGLETKLVTNFVFSGYYDLYRFPWLKFSADLPSYGKDAFLQVDHKTKNIYHYLRYQVRERFENSDSGKTAILELRNKKKIRYHFEYSVTSFLKLKSRIDHVWIKSPGNWQTGLLLYQDIHYRPEDMPFNIDFRYAIFDTDTYEARIYAYENDLLYSFSVPAFYNQGFRYYINLKYEIAKNLDFWLKFAQTKFTDQYSIGSGLSEISGNVKSEIRAQLRFKF